MPSMICYHGSDTIVDAPKILEPSRPLDFGGGFYVTTSPEQAASWARRVSYRNNTHHPCVSRYLLDLDEAKKQLSVLVFEYANEAWLDFICANRSGQGPGNYDIVIGPVADDRVYRVVVEYENGDLDKTAALKALRAEALCDQILFHTERALSFLHYLETEVLTNE